MCFMGSSCSSSSSESRTQTLCFSKGLCTFPDPQSSSGGTRTSRVVPGKALASAFILFPAGMPSANCWELMSSVLLLSRGNSRSCCPSKNPWEIQCF